MGTSQGGIAINALDFFYPEYLSDGRSNTGNYEPLKETIEQFIKEVEDHSLHD
jgi:hypothetical protein